MEIFTANVDGPPALAASSATSVSADQAVLLFSVSSTRVTRHALTTAPRVVVHLLDVDDQALAVRCADLKIDRFADATTW